LININYNSYLQPAILSKCLLKNKPMRVWYDNKPVVLIRTDNLVTAFEDFCPHRGSPLSEGLIINNQIQCKYHGWRFDCVNGLNSLLPVKNTAIDCSLKSFIVLEKYDIVWLGLSANDKPPELQSYKPEIMKSGIIKAKLINTLENFLEGSHTHFVHNWLIRSHKKERQQIEAKLVPNEIGFRVHYAAEKAKGMLTKALPQKYQNLKPIATYIYPNIAILEYFNQQDELISRIEAIVSEINSETRYFARIFLDIGFFTPLASLLGKFAFAKIISQDKEILETQNRNLLFFPNNKFVSDETDIVGQQLLAWQKEPEKIFKETVHFKVYW
jgi:phenylpropionate dioxygenase-like ring-hydroxylating dioxygenase large terminal subunit